jgi:hypothetical protein
MDALQPRCLGTALSRWSVPRPIRGNAVQRDERIPSSRRLVLLHAAAGYQEFWSNCWSTPITALMHITKAAISMKSSSA